MLEKLSKCTICAHQCGVDRTSEKLGFCKSTDKIKIALVSLHKYEEPCISSGAGSGTIFFSNCNLKCAFCQNYKISQLSKGYFVSITELANIFLEQQKNNATNINLVTPTIYAPQIIEAIKLAKSNGLNIPIIYNTNGYESIETIKSLNGYIDVYLPDFKYFFNDLGKKYSGINNYFEIASQAILEMYYQVGLPQFDTNGNIKKGLIIRHLVLPNNLDNSKKVLDWIRSNLPKKTYISIMSQYFPTYNANKFPEISRNLTLDEYNEIKKYFLKLGFENGYFQDACADEEKYVPDF